MSRTSTHRVVSARLFIQAFELGSPPPPHPQASMPTPLVGGGGAHSLPGEGVEGSQFRRGDQHCSTLGIDVICANKVPSLKDTSHNSPAQNDPIILGPIHARTHHKTAQSPNNPSQKDLSYKKSNKKIEPSQFFKKRTTM